MASFFAIIFFNSSFAKFTEKNVVIQSELKYALEILEKCPENDIFLIPIRLDDCHQVPNSVHGIQWLNMFPSWENGINKLCRVVTA